MSRGKNIRAVRPVNPDPLYGSKIITKIINRFMLDGNKTTVMNAFYKAIDVAYNDIYAEYQNIKQTTETSRPKVILWFIEYLVNKVAPSIEIRTRRIGGSNYQIPTPVPARRGLSLAILWIVNGCRARKERTLSSKMAAEIKDIIAGRGEALKKKDMVQKTAEANRAFAHFANKKR